MPDSLENVDEMRSTYFEDPGDFSLRTIYVMLVPLKKTNAVD